MQSTTALLLILSPLMIFAFWHISSSAVPPPPSHLLKTKRVILLIAHPDDESMFFSPTLQSLTDPSMSNHLKILCLSTGNNDGLGDTRKRELEKAALTLGVRRREDVFIMDDPRFQDGMQNQWDPAQIAKVLSQAFAPQLVAPSTPTAARAADTEKLSKSKASKKHNKPPLSTTTSSTPAANVPGGPRATIDVLITFDSSGISNHPNHIALYHGARLFVSNIMHGYSGYACPVTLYTLPTVNILRKYSFILDVIPTLLSGIYGTIFGSGSSQSGWPGSASKADRYGDRVVFVSDVAKYWKAREAMTQGHKSQMVWFRWGWIGLGRYMVVNDLRRERVLAT